MTNVNAETDNQNTLQEEYLKAIEDLEEGQLIDGEVVQISDDTVFVDVGYKSEGKVPLTEFTEKPNIGEKVSVILIKKEGRGGAVIVSKLKADIRLVWKKIRQASIDKTPVPGKIVRCIKGGFEVDLGHGIIAFNPLSQIDVSKTDKPESYVGLESSFIIDRMSNDNRNRIVVFRRAFLENEIEKNRESFFNSVEIGDTVEGTVKSFTSFGAFIDLGGFDGLLHINDMSWGHVTRPKDYVKKGMKIKLKVIKMDMEENKINLSLKHFTPDPWNTFEDKYQVNDIVKGRVTKLAEYGAFIEIEEGIEGLAHISELSWVKRIKHPKEILQVGDEVEAKILAYDIQNGRISLGVKQVYPNPWDTIADRYPAGSRFKRTVKKVTNAGAFIELENGIDGFLHSDDISWTKKVKKPSSILNEGDEIEVVVLSCDKENKRIRLGIKQLTTDPWQELSQLFPKGSVLEGEIVNITDFGIFLKVQGDIEGLISKSNILGPDEEKDENILVRFSVGQKIKATVIDINIREKKLSLSIREYQKNLQRKELSKYIHDDEEDSATFTLGDMLKKKGDES